MRRLSALVALAAVPLAVLGVLFVLPVSGMVSRGFDGGLAPVLDVLQRPRVHRVLWFTLWSSTVATAIAVVLGVPAASVLYRLRWPGSRVVRALVLAPFVMPTVVVGIAFRQLTTSGGLLGSLGLDHSAAAIIAGLVFFNVPMVVRTVGLVWEGLDPEPAESATVLGASPWQVFTRVTLPTLRPAIAGSAAVVFLFCATAFGVVLMLGGLRYSSVETEIYLLTTNLLDLQGAAALSLLQLVVVIVLLLVAGRVQRSVPTERSTAQPRHLTRTDVPALLTTAAVAAAILLPIATLVAGSLRREGAWTLLNYRHLGTVAGDAVGNSLLTAVIATAIALGFGTLVAFLVSRPSASPLEARVRRLLDGVFMLPLGVSAVTLGFGFLLTLGSFRDSPWLVPLAQALVALPLVVRTLVPVWSGIDPLLRDAAATLGAGPGRVLREIDLPAIRGALLGAAGLAAAVSLGEFGATSFLAREDHLTLPVLIYRLLSHPGADNLGGALAASVVLAAITTLVLLAGELASRAPRTTRR
ncbi:ABC transporter permease [Nocardioides sp. Kera G14]|uniref:ABC transporter permease n=1 Tax=Nocardioides sp. Kera G14 TaxID=2884264 RepID=UPI001D1222FF|nr:iron ABC transporter permease [Nocardioides sp. Kera G14]UDY23835.1 iron ABC transporter permease [Nocardioides sp. Kera G14]